MTQTSPPPIVDKVNRRLIRPLQDFLHEEASAGMLLVVAAVVALIWANSPLSDAYFDLWNTEAVIEIGSFSIDLTLKEWVNDLAMVRVLLRRRPRDQARAHPG